MRREKTQRQNFSHFPFQDFIAIVHDLTFFLKLQFLEFSDCINIFGFIQSKNHPAFVVSKEVCKPALKALQMKVTEMVSKQTNKKESLI